MQYYTTHERYEEGNAKLYVLLDLLDVLLDSGRDEDSHFWHWSNMLEKDENNIELCQELFSNLENPSEEFLTILLSMLKQHVKECLSDFKRDVTNV